MEKRKVEKAVRRMWFYTICMGFAAVILVLVLWGVGRSSTMNFAWEDPPDTDLDHVSVFASPTQGQYTNPTDKVCEATAGQQTCSWVRDVQGPQQEVWYAVAIAVDQAGNESEYSNEITFQISDHTNPSPCVGFTVNVVE